MPIALTTTYWKIKQMPTKIKVIQGGASAGKNIGIETLIFEDCIKKPQICTIMTDTYDNLKDGAIQDYRYIFEWAGLNFDEYYNKQDKEIKIYGSVIQFRYISDNKTHAGKSKRRDQLYINETNKIGWEIAYSFIQRTHGNVYLDLNPEFETWVHTQIPKLLDVNGKPLSSQIIVTYKDNEKCPQSEIDMIEARKEMTSWYRVFGLGEVGFYSDRQIYSYQFTDEIPATAKRLPSGQDYGFSPDPTTHIDLWLDGINLYADEVFTECNLEPVKLPGLEKYAVVDKLDEIKHLKGWLIIGDSEAARTIQDIHKHGYNIRGVKKNVSVIEGIKLVRSYNLFITKRSTGIKKACESWFFKVDDNGKIIHEPDGHEPDQLAAIRYVIMMKGKLWN